MGDMHECTCMFVWCPGHDAGISKKVIKLKPIAVIKG